MIAALFGHAWRRLGARPAAALATGLAVAVACGLVLLVGVLGERARESSARGSVAELAPRARTVEVTARVMAGTRRAPAIRAGRRALAGLPLDGVATVLVGGPVSPADERGTRVVTGVAPRLVSGRAPERCDAALCEVVALRGLRVGARLPLGRVRAVVVGRGEAAARVSGRAVTVGDADVFRVATRAATLTVVTSGVLRPGGDLGAIAERMREAAARAERADPGTRVVTPAAALRAFDLRGRTAQRRLLLIGAQGAALFLAFAALLGVARRGGALGDQLAALGAAAWQPGVVRLVEIAAPALAGALAAVALALAAGPPAEALMVVAVLTAAAIAAQWVAVEMPRGAPGAGERGVRPRGLEIAAVACLAAIAWQAISTGGLDAAQVAGDAGLPVLLLVPALALFAGGVLVARLLPYGFRGAERLTRSRSVPARLALLGLTRGGGLAAAATTFLALALGGALFALDYRATLRAQLDAQAAFAVGTSWRGPPNAGPSPRYAIRAPVRISPGGRLDDAGDATLLALQRPPTRGLATGARVSGPALDPRAVALRITVRTSMIGSLVAELLAPGQRFRRVTLGRVARNEPLQLRARVRAPAQVVGLTFSSVLPPLAFALNLTPLEQRVPGRGWVPVTDLRDWVVAKGRGGFEGEIQPRGDHVRAEIPESDVPLLRPPYRVPAAVPAVVSEPLGRVAVDRRLTARIAGRPVPLRVVATRALLPTVTRAPDRFVLVDYDTLLAVVSAQRPGDVVPTEAWFSGPAPPGAPISLAAATAHARRDALAVGASTVLAITAVLACVLAAAGLLLAAPSGDLDGWRALGVGPAALARVGQLRVLALYTAGALSALIGAALALRLVVALVAVTAGGGVPLPPIAIHVDWAGSAALIAITGAIAAVVARRAAR